MYRFWEPEISHTRIRARRETGREREYSQNLRTEMLTDILSRGRHLSYQRNKHTTHPKTSLIKIEGVDDPSAAKYVKDESPGS